MSRPCWEALSAEADHINRVEIDHVHEAFPSMDVVVITLSVTQFYFTDLTKAKHWALRVQQSARNKRKDSLREKRCKSAGGFHTPAVLERLFEIQNGRCYYSGDSLAKRPKNYVVDHIHRIAKGRI
ncbi:MAG: hypothetical protein QM757_44055 [Paludibaculum sp.]